MLCPLQTTYQFWSARQAEGWQHVWALTPPDEDADPDDETQHPDWLALSQLEGMAYDWTERQYPGTLPFDDMWVCDHHGVLFYPRWALEWAWARMIGRNQVIHATPTP
jgi:hypothetical protein